MTSTPKTAALPEKADVRRKIRKELSVFLVGLGVLLAWAAYSALDSPQTAPPLWGYPRHLAIGLPVAILSGLHLLIGAALASFGVPVFSLLGALAATILAAFYFVFMVSATGSFPFTLSSLVVAAIPVMVSSRCMAYYSLPMPSRRPELVAIDHDDHRAEHIGRTADGRHFFLTNPFVPARGSDGGREFIALYTFDADGRLLDAQIDDLGRRYELDREAAKRLHDQRLAGLGSVTNQRIEIQPFQVERFGVVFGLVPRPPKDDGEDWWVEVQPGNYMAFTEPFDSGKYDT